ncbi:uncharacterized protein LOC142240775 isoform X1 [Haematobia irritans]|uniref:uncharacterized protein LOC142240775 isoform X1 n=2 Tax=Haematobia irritans TaxID=7368 RepID=UPI003F4F884D
MNTSQTSSSPKCRVCKERHFLKYCSKFLGMPVSERRVIIREKGFCYNCLCTGHTRELCPSRSRCLVCQNNHNTLVHVDSKPSSRQNNSSGLRKRTSADNRHKDGPVKRRERPSSRSRSHFNERLSHRSRTHVFLPTALARVVTSNGPAKARMLLSSGQAETIILQSLVDRLHLRTTKRDNLNYCIVNLESYHDPLVKIQITGVVQRSFHTTLPITTKEPKLKSIYDHITDLADPNFLQPTNIEILVANDQLPKILRAGLIQTSSNMPIAQSTVFGWAISGACQY